MIGYITLGSNNIEQLGKFYDEIFCELGLSRIYSYPSYIAWGESEDDQLFSITTPFNKEQASPGNGVMIAIRVNDQETAKNLHNKAISLGGTNEGNPGERQGGFYCAYIRDIEGNKINFYHKC